MPSLHELFHAVCADGFHARVSFLDHRIQLAVVLHIRSEIFLRAFRERDTAEHAHGRNADDDERGMPILHERESYYQSELEHARDHEVDYLMHRRADDGHVVCHALYQLALARPVYVRNGQAHYLFAHFYAQLIVEMPRHDVIEQERFEHGKQRVPDIKAREQNERQRKALSVERADDDIRGDTVDGASYEYRRESKHDD